MKNKFLLAILLLTAFNLSAQQKNTVDKSLTEAAKNIVTAINKGDSLLAQKYYITDSILDSLIAEVGTAKSDSDKISMRKLIARKKERFVPSVLEYSHFLQSDSSQKTVFVFQKCSSEVADKAGSVTSSKVTIEVKAGAKLMSFGLTGVLTKKGWYFIDKMKVLK